VIRPVSSQLADFVSSAVSPIHVKALKRRHVYFAKRRTLKEIGSPTTTMCTSSP
jgi:hypothetical protein